MLLFWIVSIVLVIAAALAFVIPVTGDNKLTGATRDQLNKDLYKSRISELADDEDQGLLDKSAEFIDEMQRGLLDDVVDEKAAKVSTASSPFIWLAGVVFLVVFSVSVYLTLGARDQVANWEDVYSRLPELTNRVMNDGDKVTDQEISDFKLALTTKMVAEPDNEFGWLLLGRLNVALGDSNAAFIAMDRAYKLAPMNTSIVTGYAQALMLSDDPDKNNLARKILMELKQEKPGDIEVLSTSAFMALENQDYLGAIEQWQRMLPLLAGQPDRLQMIEGSIEYARKQIAAKNGSAPVANHAESSVDSRPVATSTETSTATSDVVTGNEQVTITITADQAEMKGYLYVYVKAAAGPKAPLAVKRIMDPTFPLTITLSDSDAMMAQMKMSQFPSIKVSAKLSQDSDVTTKEDDINSNIVTLNEGDARAVTLNLSR
ncbi:c-type cytochrome biogenesis protein CcmI [Moritella sp. F3]|uniref:c-type cytochrome biogenesis protein CcmI n=1 Tax=Moritella sp. F3 TaxID=2718882 RepID=UPI0018E14006|nr:c-type cytochrome biogenesis protein CcmI [Moritella sp. F3]GIC78020.1 c-type cytochrome biogenesis protein CcmI [Moritella sp. F1]GIC82579.1 c-type cytochrome biogenesis protein CcmI [Moritella sp. F3]